MRVASYAETTAETIQLDGAKGVSVRWLIGEKEGAPNFAMRHFEIEPGGHTPKHHHPYEHEVFILEGQGIVLEGDTNHTFQAGDSVYVISDEIHQFRNTGDRPIRMICMVPLATRCD